MSNHKKPQNNNNRQRLTAIFLAATLGITAGTLLAPEPEKPNQIGYGDLVEQAESGKIDRVTVQGQTITGTIKDTGEKFESFAPENENVYTTFKDNGVNVEAKPRESGGLGTLFFTFGPILLLIGAYVYLIRRQMGGNGMTKSPAKLLEEDQKTVTFDDVAGIDEAKEELGELVGFLKDPEKYSRLGGEMPTGALLIGPPGTGKTLTARAVAGEAGVPFYRTSGSDFVEMFVGRGAGRVREMFAEAKKKAPCIIFIDEIDAIGGKRGVGMGNGGHDEREQTLNQLLVEMDGFDGSEGVIIIAATNRPDTLDDALTRPGRFDRQVTVPLPDLKGRRQILDVHARKITHMANDVDIAEVAKGTPGFSGAELANLVNESALMAVRNGHDAVYMSDFENAKDKIMMGAERNSLIMTKEEKELTAYHEAGHALMAILQPDSDPIHKATIIPRGRALGMVMRLPEGDRVSMSLAKLKADLVVAMGGRVAEEMLVGPEKITTGASGDIHQATNMARKMVTEWGLSKELGRVRYADDQQSFTKSFSEATSEKVDSEIKRFVEEAYDEAQKLMKDNKDKWENIAQALMEYETLTGAEIITVADGGKIERTAPKKYTPPPKANDNDPSSGEGNGKPRQSHFTPGM